MKKAIKLGLYTIGTVLALFAAILISAFIPQKEFNLFTWVSLTILVSYAQTEPMRFLPKWRNIAITVITCICWIGAVILIVSYIAPSSLLMTIVLSVVVGFLALFAVLTLFCYGLLSGY